MPHAHILIWLSIKLSLDDIDDLISAEIPDIGKEPELHNIVINHMVHNECNKNS